MRNRHLPLSDQAFLENLYAWARIAPKGMDVYSVVKRIREHLHMTQAQLAKLTGMPQSHIAKIETGKVDVQLQTLKKIFEALSNDLVILPAPRKKVEKLLAERAHELAKRKVSRAVGTMALEKQKPDDRMIKEMIAMEEAKLIQNPTSEIWED